MAETGGGGESLRIAASARSGSKMEMRPGPAFAYSWGHHAVGVSRRGGGRVRPAVAAIR